MYILKRFWFEQIKEKRENGSPIVDFIGKTLIEERKKYFWLIVLIVKVFLQKVPERHPFVCHFQGGRPNFGVVLRHNIYEPGHSCHFLILQRDH